MKLSEIDRYTLSELEIEIHELELCMDICREILRNSSSVNETIQALLEKSRTEREEKIDRLMKGEHDG
jgi:hypothetical protein